MSKLRARSRSGSALTNVTVHQATPSIAHLSRRSSRARPSASSRDCTNYFPRTTLVAESLAGLADAIEPGGHLIYTNQPWHPQVEFIARVLRNREGQPWIMRRRTTAEMDELVQRAGFEKIEMEIDQWGMFSVSVARRSRSLRNALATDLR